MSLYQVLGWATLILTLVVTAPYWLRKLNGWTIKTKDKRFMATLKFLRKLHKPAGIALVMLALWHGFSALGSLRLHTGLLAYAGFVITGLLGVVHWLKKDKRAFKGHKVMALVTALLIALHILWPGAIWYIFGV